jgi:hypothetical protein
MSDRSPEMMTIRRVVCFENHSRGRWGALLWAGCC